MNIVHHYSHYMRSTFLKLLRFFTHFVTNVFSTLLTRVVIFICRNCRSFLMLQNCFLLCLLNLHVYWKLRSTLKNIKQSVQNLSEIISKTADLIYMWFYFFIFHRYIYTYLYVNTCQKLNVVELNYSLSMIYSISII